MNIDLFTAAAQIVNFLILILLLRRFLYGRIIRAMDERQNRILAEQADAERKRADAARAEAEYRRKESELNEQRGAILARVGQEAGTERNRLFQEARSAVDAEKSRWEESLRSRQEAFYRELREGIGREALDTARNALRDLAGQDLDRRIIETFIERLRGLDESRKRELSETVRASGRSPETFSSMEIPIDLREELSRVIHETFQTDSEVRFGRSPNLIGGIELRMDGSKLAWSMENYLSGLEERLAGVLNGGFRSERMPGAPPVVASGEPVSSP